MRWCGRLRRSSEIAFVRRRGRRAVASTLVAYATGTAPGTERAAITVSKAVGGAVVRNLVRRRIRAALDAIAAPEQSLRLVLVLKPSSATESYRRLASDVGSVIERLAGPP